MELREYLFHKRMSVKEFAEVLDYSRTHISAIVNDKSIPGQKLIRRIERATNGDVKKEDYKKVKKIVVENEDIEKIIKE